MKRTLLFFIVICSFVISSCHKEEMDSSIDAATIVNVHEIAIQNINEQLNNGKDILTAVNNCIEIIKQTPDVSSAYIQDDNIIITYNSGVVSIIALIDDDDESVRMNGVENNFYGNKKSIKTKSENGLDLITNHKVFIWEPFMNGLTSSSRLTGEAIKNIFESSSLDFSVTHLKKEECTLSSLKNLTQYGFIYIKTHGGVYENRDGEKVIWLISGEKYDPNAQLTSQNEKIIVTIAEAEYENDFEVVGLTVKDTHWGFSNKFISNQVNGKFSSPAIVFVQACHSYDNLTLRNAFIDDKKASAFLGYQHRVTPPFGYEKAIEFIQNLLNNQMEAEQAYNSIEVKQDNTIVGVLSRIFGNYAILCYSSMYQSYPTYFAEENYVECSSLNKRWNLQYCMFNSNNSTEFEYSSSSLTFMGTGTPSDVVSDIHIDFQISRCNNLIAGTYTPFNISDTSDVNNWENHNYPMRFLTGSYKNWYGAAVGYVPYGSTVSVNSNNYTLTGGNINVQYNNDLRTVSFSFTDENGHYYTGRWKD